MGEFQPRKMEEVEKEHVLAMLEHFKGNRTKTAWELGITTKTLHLWLKRWDAFDAFRPEEQP